MWRKKKRKRKSKSLSLSPLNTQPKNVKYRSDKMCRKFRVHAWMRNIISNQFYVAQNYRRCFRLPNEICHHPEFRFRCTEYRLCFMFSPIMSRSYWIDEDMQRVRVIVVMARLLTLQRESAIEFHQGYCGITICNKKSNQPNFRCVPLCSNASTACS